METENAFLARCYAEASTERDRARSANQYLWGACALLFAALLFVAANPPKRGPINECPSPNVMQLDPETIRSRAYETQEL